MTGSVFINTKQFNLQHLFKKPVQLYSPNTRGFDRGLHCFNVAVLDAAEIRSIELDHISQEQVLRFWESFGEFSTHLNRI